MITFSPGTIFFAASLVLSFVAFRITARQEARKPRLWEAATLIAVFFGIAVALDLIVG